MAGDFTFEHKNKESDFVATASFDSFSSHEITQWHHKSLFFLIPVLSKNTRILLFAYFACFYRLMGDLSMGDFV